MIKYNKFNWMQKIIPNETNTKKKNVYLDIVGI